LRDGEQLIGGGGWRLLGYGGTSKARREDNWGDHEEQDDKLRVDCLAKCRVRGAGIRFADSWGTVDPCSRR